MRYFLRAYGNYDSDAVSRGTAVDYSKSESRTVQSARDECDINTIVRKFGVTGQMPYVSRIPTYELFDNVYDFQSAMNAVRAADEAFMAMDSDVRARFQNDPQRFVEFCSDSRNLAEMRSMGLAIPEKKEDTIPTPEIPPVVKEKNRGSAGKSVQRSGPNVGDAGEASD